MNSFPARDNYEKSYKKTEHVDMFVSRSEQRGDSQRKAIDPRRSQGVLWYVSRDSYIF